MPSPVTVKSGPIPSGLLSLPVEAVFWDFVMKLEDHKTLHCLSCSSSVWCSLLEKKRKLKKSSCMCESICTRCGFSEDTSSNASVGAIFRYPLFSPTVLFKDSVQAANRYIYNHPVDGPSMNATADDAILGGSCHGYH